MSEPGEKAKRTRAIHRSLEGLIEASRLVADRASSLELYAAKNAKAGRDQGAASKQKEADRLRHIATFLATKELRDAILTNERLVSSLMGETPMHVSYDHLHPRHIDVDAVKPSVGWADRRYGGLDPEHFKE